MEGPPPAWNDGDGGAYDGQGWAAGPLYGDAGIGTVYGDPGTYPTAPKWDVYGLEALKLCRRSRSPTLKYSPSAPRNEDE